MAVKILSAGPFFQVLQARLVDGSLHGAATIFLDQQLQHTLYEVQCKGLIFKRVTAEKHYLRGCSYGSTCVFDHASHTHHNSLWLKDRQ